MGLFKATISRIRHGLARTASTFGGGFRSLLAGRTLDEDLIDDWMANDLMKFRQWYRIYETPPKNAGSRKGRKRKERILLLLRPAKPGGSPAGVGRRT